MSFRIYRSGFSRISVLIILLTGASTLFGVDLNTLIEKSPFLPKGYNSKKNEDQLVKQPVKNSTLEFKSMVKIGDEWQFSVHDKSANKYYWVTKSKKDPNAQLLDFNIESETITVNINGTQQTLTRSKPNYAAMTPPPMPVPANANATPNNAPIPAQTIQSSTNDTSTDRKPIIRRRIIRPTRTN